MLDSEIIFVKLLLQFQLKYQKADIIFLNILYYFQDENSLLLHLLNQFLLKQAIDLVIVNFHLSYFIIRSIFKFLFHIFITTI